jgi:hypothetical protein
MVQPHTTLSMHVYDKDLVGRKYLGSVSIPVMDIKVAHTL